MDKPIPLWHAVLPLFVLLIALFFNIRTVGDAAQDGSNQLILIASGLIAALMGWIRGVHWQQMMEGVEKNIASTSQAIIILLLIGALAGSWMAGGIVPAMIYYGTAIMHPSYFLPATAIICAVVALVTGSSWSTTATVGLALMAMSTPLGIPLPITAGAVISGAYFGDKLSPLSDTTNLAAAMGNIDVIHHIKYLSITTIPSFVIALIAYAAISVFYTNGQIEALAMRSELPEIYDLNPLIFLAPLATVVLIIKKMPAIPALSIGVLAGVLCVVFFQRNTMSNDITYELLHNIILGTNQPSTDSEEMKNLLTTGGMAGMLNTIWLILSAMFFGGIMEACGFLNRMTSALLHRAKGDTALTAATALSAVTVNISASDQYLAIVIPGRMFAGSFHDQQLAAENLTRTLEDAGTVTSPLIPWNTCGAYQSNILGVNALAFAPFAFFNILSPIATLVFMKLNIKIKRIKQDNTSSKI